MSDDEFQEALRELRGEFTAPSEVAEVTARLFEALRAENKQLRSVVSNLANALIGGRDGRLY